MDHNMMTNKIVQAGGDTFGPGDGDNSGVNEGEFANAAVLEKLPGYSSTKLWASNGQLTKANIAKGFNDNVDFVLSSEFSQPAQPIDSSSFHLFRCSLPCGIYPD